MSSSYEMIEDNRNEFPELERVSLGPVTTRYFGTDTFEVISPEMSRSSIIAGYVIDKNGVFSVEGHGPEVVSQGNPADARALALATALSGEAVLIGPGTLRAEPGNRWDILEGLARIPSLREDEEFLAEMKTLANERGLGRKTATFVATRSGSFHSDTDLGLFFDDNYDSFVVTTMRGQENAEKAVAGGNARVLVYGENEIDYHAFLAYTRARGIKQLSLQGGKMMFEPILREGLIGQLLLSVIDSRVSQQVEGERKTLFPNGASVPSRKARLITARRAEGITLRNYDMREVNEL